MIVHHEIFSFELRAEFDAADLSAAVEEAIDRSGVQEGILTVFTLGSTSAVTTIEYESGCLQDLKRALDRIAPTDEEYAHNLRWGDGNGFSHLRAALLGPSLSVPIQSGRASFSTWQQPILVNCDNRARNRRVLITVVGEPS